MLIGNAENIVERSPKKILVDGFDIKVIRRAVEHFCIENETVATLNKFLSAIKGKKVYIFVVKAAICCTQQSTRCGIQVEEQQIKGERD
jgi:hypothetical protein